MEQNQPSMNYELVWSRIKDAAPAEQEALLNSILANNGATEDDLLQKELALNKLAAHYCAQGQQAKVLELQLAFNFAIFTPTRAAKIFRQFLDLVAQLENTLELQIVMCQESVQWCTKNKKTYERQKNEIKLANLYHQQGQFGKGIEIIDRIIIEVRKADDKHMLLEIYLVESKLHFGQLNIPKAKASLTAARACSNSIYCPPHVQADIDLQAGILYAEERDYQTAYSYFYESFEAYNNLESSKAESVLKYMLLCKIMNNKSEDVHQILIGKFGLKYAGRNLDAMKAINQTNQKKSLIDFTKVLANYKKEVEDDSVIKLHIQQLYEMLLEKNLFQVISPYSRVQIDYITQRMQIDSEVVQRKLSELILDKKIDGTLDQGNNCLILFDTVKHDNMYRNSLSLINNLNGVLDKLFERVKQV